MDLGDGVWGSGRPVRRRRPWSLRLLVGLQGRGGAAGERNMGANGNDLAILAAWGRAGGRTDARAAGGRRVCDSPFLVGGCFCLTLPLPFRVVILKWLMRAGDY